jgi:hypothetical protein
MAGRITLGDVQRPPGSVEGWLSQRARAAPGSNEPVAAIVLGNGGLTRAVREGIVLDHLGTVEGSLVRTVRPDWVGAVGGGVLLRDGRPLIVRFARVRRESGMVWVAVWLRVAGVPMGAAPDEVWTGKVSALPAWLKPLVPDWPDGAAGTEVDPPVADGPQTLQWRRDPAIAPPGFRITVPEGAAFRDVVELAAGVLVERFSETGQADPTVVVWSDGELCGWWAEGARGAREAHALGRRIARDAGVQAVGMFGLGRDKEEDGASSLVMLAMEDRELGPVMWVRHFDRPAGQARPSWTDEAGVVRAPGPRMGWFER